MIASSVSPRTRGITKYSDAVLVGAHVVDGQDVRVLERADRADLVDEARERARAAHIGAKALDGDLAPDVEVFARRRPRRGRPTRAPASSRSAGARCSRWSARRRSTRCAGARWCARHRVAPAAAALGPMPARPLSHPARPSRLPASAVSTGPACASGSSSAAPPSLQLRLATAPGVTSISRERGTPASLRPRRSGGTGSGGISRARALVSAICLRHARQCRQIVMWNPCQNRVQPRERALLGFGQVCDGVTTQVHQGPSPEW